MIEKPKHISPSSLKMFVQSHDKYSAKLHGLLPYQETDPILVGNAVEKLLFEDAYGDDYSKLMTKKGEGQKNEKVKTMVDVLHHNAGFSVIDGKTQVEIVDQYKDMKLLGYADFIGEFTYKGKTFEGILDLKTTSNMYQWKNNSYRQFNEFQHSMYPFMLSDADGNVPAFYYLVISTTKPHDYMLIEYPSINMFEDERFGYLQDNLNNMIEYINNEEYTKKQLPELLGGDYYTVYSAKEITNFI